ncbi:MAG: translation elongation factor Ts [Patescibacteria group bacterium]
MSEITAQAVAQLREMTGAGMMDAKKALVEANGDLTEAAEVLRKSGVIKALSKAERATNEGCVHAYIHSNAKSGAMVEVLCETDFVARNEAFVELCHDLALHICASAPICVSRDQVSTELVEKEKEMYRAELAGQGKPAEMMEKIIEGKLNKYFSEIVLLEQMFVKDDTKTIDQLVKEKITTLGENIQVRRFSRFVLGA